MLVVRIIISLFLLIGVVDAQEFLIEQVEGGHLGGIKRQKRAVPRYFICGAGAWNKRQVTPAVQQCQRHCNQHKTNDNPCQTTCKSIPEVHHRTRVNGLKFQLCHFQNWYNQKTLIEMKKIRRQGLKMCPKEMYVYGMRAKLSERDGLAGLILLCRSIIDTARMAEVLIFDGEGWWRDAYFSSNYAVGFKVRFRDSFIYGLHLEMSSVPFITSFNLTYQLPTNQNPTITSYTQKFTYTNYRRQPMTKQIDAEKQRQYTKLWENNKKQLHGQSLYKLLSKSLMNSLQIQMPNLLQSTHQKRIGNQQNQQNQQKQQMTMRKRGQKLQTFRFGITEKYKVGEKKKEVIKIPPCTRLTISQTVFVSKYSVPYTVQLVYSNCKAVEHQNISGSYRSTGTGAIETTQTIQRLQCN